MTARLVVLASGNGSNLGAILDACGQSVVGNTTASRLDAEVVAVVSNVADAFALERARAVGIDAELVPTDGRSRAMYDGVLTHVVEAHRPDLIVLAGWMRILTNGFLRRFEVINLHPALPGAFPGLHAIERTFEAWQNGDVDRGGVMVHRVPDEGVDDGPVIATAVVPIEPDDTLERFEQRVHEIEHRLIVDAIRMALDTLSSTDVASPSTAPTTVSPTTVSPTTVSPTAEPDLPTGVAP